MTASRSDRVLRQVCQLFDFGRVGTMSDAQLLDRFVSRRDEVSDAAFEALVIRHGPMVLRVCRSVLHDWHDAEDAVQAVFLVLANRAGSIRRRESVASWLFGVAHRVSVHVKRGASRRRALDQLVASQILEEDSPTQNDFDREVLHKEINDLPERLRAPIVLCYLQGLTYYAAADRLGLSAAAIRGRLARARERLRRRLICRSVTIPAGLLAAGAVHQAEAAIPVTLIQSTVRIALGFTAGNTAAVLARGVLNSMLITRIKVATVLVCLGIGSSFWAWHAFAATDDKNPQVAGPNVVISPDDAPMAQASQPAVTFGLSGSVRLEGTGEPIAGATVEVMVGETSGPRPEIRTVRSGTDGRFIVDLPPGSARVWTPTAPVGYWMPDSGIEEFAVSKSDPFLRKDYLVRRGTVWDFRITCGDETKAIPGVVVASGEGAFFRSAVDDAANVRLTLPAEKGKVTASVWVEHLQIDRVPINLEWESGFTPAAIKSVTNLGGSPARYRLSDDHGKTATLSGIGRIRAEPRLDGKRLIVAVLLPAADTKAFGDLVGKIVDASGGPIARAQVALVWVEQRGGSAASSDDRHLVRTDAGGNFLIRSITRTRADGKPAEVKLVVTKDGFAGVETAPITFEPPSVDRPQVAETVTLSTGVSLTGTVVDPEGKPLSGVWVTPEGSYASRFRFTKTDDAGRFTVRDLPTGMVALNFRYGKLFARGRYMALRNVDPLTIKLRPMPDAANSKAQAEGPKAARPKPPAIGTPAPEWKTGEWSDGRARSLKDYRGKIVLLDFWGTWCSPCVKELPTLERLKQKYEPRGVVFLSIHTPDDGIEQIRHFLKFKKLTLVSGTDEDAGKQVNLREGVTANRYGVEGYPTLVMIDREGNVVFHNGIDSKEYIAAVRALGKELGLEESKMTETDYLRVLEAFFSRAIERVLNRP